MGRNGPWIGGKLTERPSRIFRRHVRVVPYPEDDIPRIVRDLPDVDCLVMGSDFPHAEGLAEPAEFAALSKRITAIFVSSPDLPRCASPGTALSAVLSVMLTVTFTERSGRSVAGSLGIVAVLALPVSMGVAILRYRLYDIDRLISRTLAYAIVTGLLVGMYAAVVALAGAASFSSPVEVAAATLAAAALFNPQRRRVQRVVDRRFNRARYDADQTVAAFAARLQDTVDLDSVRDDLADVVHQALEPAHLWVWISQRE